LRGQKSHKDLNPTIVGSRKSGFGLMLSPGQMSPALLTWLTGEAVQLVAQTNELHSHMDVVPVLVVAVALGLHNT